ncbi:hypothetical protein SBV1_30051 [Verrucomicrobia bacterium]|nr:hypothetical protein SBV1_30051 [Verrucomicrobiota bacterium]
MFRCLSPAQIAWQNAGFKTAGPPAAAVVVADREAQATEGPDLDHLVKLSTSVASFIRPPARCQ